jgi:hypothetical protein
MSATLTVGELFKVLSYGELGNLSLGMEGAGSIEESAQPRIMLHVNEGLLRLYSRLVLMEKDLLIEMVGGITSYHLDPRFGEAAWDREVARYPYIKDGLDPFTGDLIKILAVYDSYGRTLPLNDDEHPESLFTPQANMLQVPRPRDRASLSLVYQAKHPPLSHERPEEMILLPEVLHGALTAFVGWKVYSFMNTAEATVKAAEHKLRYEEITLGAVAADLVSTSFSTTNARFAKRGWI